MLETLERKKQLSLGYSADIVPHSEYDFEQIDINPHHLAVVENGRCGPLCCFLDRKPELKTQEIEVNSMKKKAEVFFMMKRAPYLLSRWLRLQPVCQRQLRRFRLID